MFLCLLKHHIQFAHSKNMNQYETYQTENLHMYFQTKPKPYLIKIHSANPNFIHKSLLNTLKSVYIHDLMPFHESKSDWFL